MVPVAVTLWRKDHRRTAAGAIGSDCSCSHSRPRGTRLLPISRASRPRPTRGPKSSSHGMPNRHASSCGTTDAEKPAPAATSARAVIARRRASAARAGALARCISIPGSAHRPRLAGALRASRPPERCVGATDQVLVLGGSPRSAKAVSVRPAKERWAGQRGLSRNAWFWPDGVCPIPTISRRLLMPWA